MHKTVVLLLSAAFVATLPSIASAKKMKHRHHREAAVVQAYNDQNSGPRFLGAALHQLVVPLEVTFAPRQY
ncbi:MAG: hypothetical protein V7604_3151 [Hyphomicrobiales bacterium]|jgi:hypothetical protein